jgi:dipeptidyl-peptidase-4
VESQLLWLSERDGWRHLYRYDLGGTLVGRVTEGPWEVDAYHGYDAERGAVYFSGDRADVKGQQLFRVGLDGAGLEQITEEPGTHAVTLAPDFAHFADTFSSHTTPPRRTLCRIDGSALRTLDQVDPGSFACCATPTAARTRRWSRTPGSTSTGCSTRCWPRRAT